jgi:hypothetical protein
MQADLPSSKARKNSVLISCPNPFPYTNKSMVFFILTLHVATLNYLSSTINWRICELQPANLPAKLSS